MSPSPNQHALNDALAFYVGLLMRPELALGIRHAEVHQRVPQCHVYPYAAVTPISQREESGKANWGIGITLYIESATENQAITDALNLSAAVQAALMKHGQRPCDHATIDDLFEVEYDTNTSGTNAAAVGVYGAIQLQINLRWKR